MSSLSSCLVLSLSKIWFFENVFFPTNSSSRTLNANSCCWDETYSSLAPLTDVPLPRCTRQDVDPLESHFDLMNSRGVDPLGSKRAAWANSLSSTPLLSGFHLSRGTLKLFESNTSFNCPGAYVGSTFDMDKLSEYCSFGDGYSVSPPLETDRMWAFSSQNANRGFFDEVVEEQSWSDFHCWGRFYCGEGA